MKRLHDYAVHDKRAYSNLAIYQRRFAWGGSK